MHRHKNRNKGNLSVQNKYYGQYLNQEKIAQENQDRIKRLEEIESSMLERLQGTMNRQLNVHKTLENLVKYGKME